MNSWIVIDRSAHSPIGMQCKWNVIVCGQNNKFSTLRGCLSLQVDVDSLLMRIWLGSGHQNTDQKPGSQWFLNDLEVAQSLHAETKTQRVHCFDYHKNSLKNTTLCSLE